MQTFWTYSITFATDIERGIQIFEPRIGETFANEKIVCSVAAIFFFLNNLLLGNGSTIHGSKDMNATFNVGGKSNRVRLLCSSCTKNVLTMNSFEIQNLKKYSDFFYHLRTM